MTSFHIFLRTGLPPWRAAGRIGAMLGMELRSGTDEEAVLARPVRGTLTGEVGGTVSNNYFAGPGSGQQLDDASLLDGYDTLFSLWTTVQDDLVARAETAGMFDELAAQAVWPMALVHDLALLVAVWSPDGGRAEFAAGTSPDRAHVARWWPHRPSKSKGA